MPNKPNPKSKPNKTSMETQSSSDGRVMLDIVDNKWREEKLPHEDIEVPVDLLPDPEADNSDDSQFTLREQEQKWTDLDLGTFTEAHQATNN